LQRLAAYNGEEEMKHEVRIPDIEVVVHAGNWDCAVIAFYADPDIHQGFHVVAGYDNHTTPAVLVEVLREAIKALSADGWKSLDELDLGAGSDGQPRPF